MENSFRAEIAADQVAIAASANKMAHSNAEKYATRGRPNHVTRKHFLGHGPRVNCKYCNLSVRNRPGGEMRNHLLKCERFSDVAPIKEMELIRSNEKSTRVNKPSMGRQMPIEVLRPSMMGSSKPRAFEKREADKRLAAFILSRSIPQEFFTCEPFTDLVSYLHPGYSGLSKSLDVYLSDLVIDTREKTILRIESSKYVTLGLNSWKTKTGQPVHAVTVVTPSKEEFLLDVILQDENMAKNAQAIMSMIPLKKVSATVMNGPGDGKALNEIFAREIPWAVSSTSFAEILNDLCESLLSKLDVKQKASMCAYIATNVNKGRTSLQIPHILKGTPSTRLTTFVECMKAILRHKDEIRQKLVNHTSCNQATRSSMFWDSLSQLVAILEPLKNLVVRSHTLFNLSDCYQELIVACRSVVEEVRSFSSWASGISEFCYEMVRVLKKAFDPSAQLALILDTKYLYLPHRDIVAGAKRALKKMASSLGADSSESDAILYEFELFLKDPRSTPNYWDAAGKEDFPYLSVFVPRILSCGSNGMSAQKTNAIAKWINGETESQTSPQKFLLQTKGYLALFSTQMEVCLDEETPILRGTEEDLVAVPDHLVENVNPLSELCGLFASEDALRQFPFSGERLSAVVDIERFKRKFDV